MIHQDGRVQLSTSSAILAMNNGMDIATLDVLDEREMELFNYYADQHCLDERLVHAEPTDHEARQSKWIYPAAFDEFDLHEFFMQACTTDVERERVCYELQLYTEYGVERLLRWCVWFMTFVEENNIFIGVGRGSSVSSYCLFLIGLHQVNSIECELDPKDFLK